jgi:hypothetical protein
MENKMGGTYRWNGSYEKYANSLARQSEEKDNYE